MEMGLADAVKLCFAKYVDFTGRAARPELWYFVLFCFIAQVVIGLISIVSPSGGNILSLIFSLGVVLPSLAVGARRLHDIDKSGWWQLISLVPLVGFIVLIYFWVQPGTPGTNRFG